MMKKLISLILCLILALSFCAEAFSVGAVSYNKGMYALKEQFQSGETTALDYVYYSPVKENDTQKYPLVIWLHGNSSGDYPGHQLDNCNFAMWSSEEYQSRFEKTHGAFLFMPRCPTNPLVVAWEGKTLSLKSTIDQFIMENADHIDTNRIYIGGYSMGGKMTIIMASKYPTFFAAAFPMSPVYAPSTSDLDELVNLPIWLMVCKNDTYIQLNQLTVNSNWNYLMDKSTCPEKCRMSTFGKIYRPDGSYCGPDEVHNTWNAACHDLFMNDNTQYLDMKVVDGLGKTVNLSYPDGLISWMSQHGIVEEEQTVASGFLQKIINAIIKVFTSIIQFLGVLDTIR